MEGFVGVMIIVIYGGSSQKDLYFLDGGSSFLSVDRTRVNRIGQDWTGLGRIGQ
jgi:hypothetical protein